MQLIFFRWKLVKIFPNFLEYFQYLEKCLHLFFILNKHVYRSYKKQFQAFGKGMCLWHVSISEADGRCLEYIYTISPPPITKPIHYQLFMWVRGWHVHSSFLIHTWHSETLYLFLFFSLQFVGLMYLAYPK